MEWENSGDHETSFVYSNQQKTSTAIDYYHGGTFVEIIFGLWHYTVESGGLVQRYMRNMLSIVEAACLQWMGRKFLIKPPLNHCYSLIRVHPIMCRGVNVQHVRSVGGAVLNNKEIITTRSAITAFSKENHIDRGVGSK